MGHSSAEFASNLPPGFILFGIILLAIGFLPRYRRES